MSPATARRAIDWKILITIGAALAVSKAMEKTGAAEALAQGLLALAGGNEGGMIAVIYLATCICSQIIMNTPAAAIIFPVAATIADQEVRLQAANRPMDARYKYSRSSCITLETAQLRI